LGGLRSGGLRRRAAVIAAALIAAGAALALALSLAPGGSPRAGPGTSPGASRSAGASTAPRSSAATSSSAAPSSSGAGRSSSAAPPVATTCQGDGSGCTKPGSYGPIDALISQDYNGLRIEWTSATVVGTPSGFPTYWTAYLTFTNVGSGTESFSCSIAAHVWADATGGTGNDGYVPATQTTCSAESGLTASLSPGQSFQFYATFHNVPWPGTQTAVFLQDINRRSPAVYTF
jgi:hypothetical protein